MTDTLWAPGHKARKRHTLKSAREMARLFGDAAKIEWRGDGKPAVAIYATCAECPDPFGVASSLYHDDTVDDLHHIVADCRANIEGFKLYVLVAIESL